MNGVAATYTRDMDAALRDILRRAWPVLAALVVAVVCGWAASTNPASELEARYGLGWLYAMRGKRPAPDTVLIVELNERQGERISIDTPPANAATADCNGLAVDNPAPGRITLGSPRTLPWPRCVHATLVDALTSARAPAIVFDMLFRTSRHRSEAERRALESQDATLAAALRRSARVVIAARVPNLACAGTANPCPPTVRIPPSGPVMDSAIATGPMLLPSQRGDIYHAFWLFDPEDFGLATLPLLAMHVRHPAIFREIVKRIATAAPRLRDQLPDYDPSESEPVRLTGAATELAMLIRQLSADEWAHVAAIDDVVTDIATAYRQADVPQILNEYGPTGTLKTIGYADAIHLAKADPVGLAALVRDRTVFVGYLQHEEKEPFEQFPTHFREPGLPDVAGVEIAATAFANLNDRSLLRTIDIRVGLAVAAAAAIAFGTFAWGPIAGGLMAGAFLFGIPGAALWSFQHANLWIPLATPLAASVAALVAGIAGLYVRERRHNARIRNALERMLPPEAVATVTDPRRRRPDLGYGLCLATDATGFTAYSEQTSPPDVVAFLTRYFRLLFAPVIDRGGFVSDVVGDSMLAVFPCESATTAPVEAVLDACVAILEAVDSAPTGHALPTRIGVSMGSMTRTMVGALSHFEYRAVGDTVNVANRLEGLNKVYGTRVLVTEEVAAAAPAFQFRDCGSATLSGRSARLRVYALLGRKADDEASPA